MNWYILQTKPKQEDVVSESLTAQGYENFNPKARTTGKRWGKVATILEPLFPNYVFVNLDLSNQNWQNAKWTKGVKDFLKMDGKPSIVDADIVNALIENHAEGFISIKNPKHQLKQGDKVKILSGPMKNLEGIFEAKNGEARSFVLLSVLTETTRVKLDTVWLEKA